MSTIPLGRRKRADEIAEHIERAISTGEFKEGGTLPSEKELAERFGVGRPSVRQALFTLQQQGLVEITSGTRARVTAPSGKFMAGQMAGLVRRLTSNPEGQEHMEQARLLFEAGVAWAAARVATDDDIRNLKAKLDANAQAMGNTAVFVRTDVAFHAELAVITRNPIFVSVNDALVGWLVDQRTTTIHMPDADRLSVRDHTAIYEAVAARDPMRAFHEMTTHLRLISELYRESKRLSEEILRQVARDVAGRIEREREAMWTSGLLATPRDLEAEEVQSNDHRKEGAALAPRRRETTGKAERKGER
ncbi:MAG TPA: GntR family transcriptional regulator [Candidatus Cybelea sp.]|nr:GntR family transcriptional regulator [Candidatus Cybelea sp.]